MSEELPPTDLMRKAATSMDMRYDPEDFDAWLAEVVRRAKAEAWRQRRDPAPRLTIHALNTAPVGSWLNRGGGPLPRLIKQSNGLWAVSTTDVGLGSEFALSEWPNATLTYPEGEDDE